MKKIFKVLLCVLGVIVVAISGFLVYCQNVISSIDKQLISNINRSIFKNQTTFFDVENNQINIQTANTKNAVKIDQLNDHTINAFIAIEDHEFFNHKGINPKRIIKAGFKNFKSGYSKEGASTITQQLVKNTLLTDEKTFDRKIKEAYLATQIENKYSKQEILENYLNVIYFGSGAYGIESASNTFFNCPASALSLCQSATLAGIIKSPKNYSPVFHSENCVLRRNLVLKQMQKLNYISKEECDLAINTPLKIDFNTRQNNDLYINYALKQACEILDLSEKDIASGGYQIYTFLDGEKSKKISKNFMRIIKNEENKKSFDGVLTVIDNSTMGVNVLISNKNAELKRRQPASLIKPLLCYAPAFEQNILAPATPILDEQIDFENYKPQNADNEYSGWITVRDALVQSKNIPAIKTLLYVGVDKAKEYAKNCGIEFDKSDNHLALALGSLKYGTTPLEIACAYCTFANDGNFQNCSFIKQIKDKNNNVIFNYSPQKKKVFSSETCYQINDILKNVPTKGTAKRLSQFKNIYAKTGTNGFNSNEQNLDAWCVAYNPEKTICSWVGNTSGEEKNNLNSNQSGSTLGAKICELVIKNLNLNFEKSFEKPNGIVNRNVLVNYKNGQKLLCVKDDNLQKNLTKNEIFTEKYASNLEFLENLMPNSINLSADINDEKLVLKFNSTPNFTYNIYKIIDNKTTKIAQIFAKEIESKYEVKDDFYNAEFFVECNFEPVKIKSNIIKTYQKTDTIKKEKFNLKSWIFR